MTRDPTPILILIIPAIPILTLLHVEEVLLLFGVCFSFFREVYRDKARYSIGRCEG